MTSTYPQLESLGWNDRWSALFAEVDARDAAPGRVIRHDGSAVLATLPTGTRHVPIHGAVADVTVGDWVVVIDNEGEGAIGSVLARTSLLERRDPSTDRSQLLAANVDRVVMVCGTDRPLRAGRIRRGVALAWEAGAVPAVAVTKTDLTDDVTPLLEEVRTADPALDVFAVSARTGTGLDDLADLAVGATLVFIGESGSGKSTLVNALVGDDVAATAPVRSGDAKGRHTTTTRQLHILTSGGCVIDSPGIRELGIWATTDSVDSAFPEIGELAPDCRFRDCAHDKEPGCAVVRAVEEGVLDPERLEAWQREAAAAELR